MQVHAEGKTDLRKRVEYLSFRAENEQDAIWLAELNAQIKVKGSFRMESSGLDIKAYQSQEGTPVKK